MLLDLLRELKALEATIEITDPVRAKAQAFLTVPDRDVVLASRKAVFENEPTPIGDEEQLGNNLEQHELVTVRLTAYDADFDRATEISVAFYDAFKAALALQRPAGMRLNGTFDHLTIQQFQSGQFQSFDGRPGWELVLDFQKFSQLVRA